MSNQRPGRTHAAAMRDDGGGNITLGSLIKVVRAIQYELDAEGEQDSSVRFEIFGDYLENEIANGTPFTYRPKMVGL